MSVVLPKYVKRVAVLGAGVMGAQIAAHCANAGIPVLLFDLPKADAPNAVAEKAIAGLAKLKPAPLASPSLAAFITPCNYAEHLQRLAECDCVIEAIAERLDWKLDLYAKIAPHVGPNTVLATNTSGLSVATLAQHLPDAIRARFCGVHFFNPPRYMHLCELIPTPHTDCTVLEWLETWLTRYLGKGVVYAKDTPNFIANRVGVAGMLSVMQRASQFGIAPNVVDELTGKRLGRAKSATYRTADVVGLDTLVHVVHTMQEGLPNCPFAALYQTPAVLKTLVDKGLLGQKTGAGFFKKEGKDILQWDTEKAQYALPTAAADAGVLNLLKEKNVALKLQQLRDHTHPQAQFLWAVFSDVFHYAAVQLEHIAHSARDIDLCLRDGFGWVEGPFEIWQQAGWLQVAQWVQADIDAGKALCKAPLPTWVSAQSTGVYAAQGAYSPASGKPAARSAVPVYGRQLFRTPIYGETQIHDGPSKAGTTVLESDCVRLWTAPGFDDVLVLSFKTKMHTISPEVLAATIDAVAKAEAGFAGLVLWQVAEPFSAGADLKSLMPAFMAGGPKALLGIIEQFQRATQALQYSKVPTVAALRGLALGGGCEYAMHCSARVAHLETYMGLVEVGVGLIPAGGGLKAIAAAAAFDAQQAGLNDVLPFIKNRYMAAATGQVSTSAFEALDMRYLQPSDPIVMNAHELLYVALSHARALSTVGYRAPNRGLGIVVGGTALQGNIMAQLINMQQGGFISEYDMHLGQTIAHVVAGGNVPAGTVVDEEVLLTLEREHFAELAGNPKTQQRVMHMLQTGKPLRN